MDYSIGVKGTYSPTFRATLGYAIHSFCVKIAPYDTGNLVHSIRLAQNTPKKIKILYPIKDVHYLPYLEHNPESKHYRFIANESVDVTKSLVKNFFESKDSFLSWVRYDRKQLLSSQARVRGYGASRVSVGYSRYNSDTRKTRRLRSNAIYQLGRKK